MVVGGGAAGLMAAGRAAEMGAPVVLLEKMDRVGRKLHISGKGRCNVTHSGAVPGLIANFGAGGRFLYSSVSAFDNQALVEFLADLGVATKVERGGRVFPASDDAGQVVQALLGYCRRNGVAVRCRAPVGGLLVEGGGIAGASLLSGEPLPAGALVVTTGGLSYPGTGSTGDGYRLAASVGHTVVPPVPSLVPLVVEEGWARDLQGLTLRNVRVRSRADGRLLGEEFGEMLFTHFGVSGPIILTLSREIAQHFAAGGGPVQLRIDLKPALSAAQLDERLQRDFARSSRRQFRHSLDELLPRSLAQVIVARSGIDAELPLHQVTRAARLGIGERIKDLGLTVTRTMPASLAMVTAGGVATREIDPRTMESKLIKGLYFAGEVVDYDARTGGYNLQAAFSTGRSAGEAAAARVRDADKG